MPIAVLRPADSPRTGEVCAEHVRSLTQSQDRLPAIIVDAATMRVIDGTHRLRAAVLRGADTIDVRLFRGGPFEVFMLAVQMNREHSPPMSLAARSAEVVRILANRPEWSDRAIASVTGLASGTVATIRARGGSGSPANETRVGRDGKVRPVSTAAGRQAAGTFFANNPGASLRAIAKAAGISTGTARDVRERLRRGRDPLLPQHRAAENQPGGMSQPVLVRPAAHKAAHRQVVLATLRDDPSLRYTRVGRFLLRLLDTHTMSLESWRQIADAVPTHRVDQLADAALECAAGWQLLAEQLEKRQRSHGHRS
jgi:hypothetical protein